MQMRSQIKCNRKARYTGLYCVAAVSCENGWCLVHCSFLVSLHFKAKFSNPSTLCSKSRLSSSWPPVPVSINSPCPLFVSFPSGRTDPVPIILKYDVMGMGRMEMEVGDCLSYPHHLFMFTLIRT